MEPEKAISYAVRGFLTPKKATEPPPMLVWQYEGDLPVNEYTGYDKGTYLKLYPRRRIRASDVNFCQHDVDITKTRREY